MQIVFFAVDVAYTGAAYWTQRENHHVTPSTSLVIPMTDSVQHNNNSFSDKSTHTALICIEGHSNGSNKTVAVLKLESAMSLFRVVLYSWHTVMMKRNVCSVPLKNKWAAFAVQSKNINRQIEIHSHNSIPIKLKLCSFMGNYNLLIKWGILTNSCYQTGTVVGM